MKIIGSRISSENFLYDSKTKSFSAEISELPKNFNGMSQVWDDSCDAGFVMVSAKTDIKVVFIHNETVRDINGDIQYHSYYAEPSFNKGKIDSRYIVTVFND